MKHFANGLLNSLITVAVSSIFSVVLFNFMDSGEVTDRLQYVFLSMFIILPLVFLYGIYVYDRKVKGQNGGTLYTLLPSIVGCGTYVILLVGSALRL